MAKKLTPEKAARLLKNPPSGRELTDSQLQYFNDVVATEPPTLAPLAKSGAWLDKYNDGGPIQENYNDASVSTPPGFVGLGYDTTGRNYSPAWGGQFQKGGNVYKSKPMAQSSDIKSASNTMLSNGLVNDVNDFSNYSTIINKYPNMSNDTSYMYVHNTPTGTEQFFHNTNQGKPVSQLQRGNKFVNLSPEQVNAYKQKVLTGTGGFAMGGSLPGATGHMYARYKEGGSVPGDADYNAPRTAGSAPANGKYTKKTMASAQNGKEMKYYQEGLDFQPKSISKNGSVIKDDRGQWAYPGEITEIGSNDITMQGVDYPVLGVSDTGDTQMMYPDQDYKFDGEKVTEYPMAKDGKWLNKYQEGGTLMKDKKVGEKISEVAKYDLRPIKPGFKTTVKEIYDPNCPDGIGCSKQATDVAQTITGLPRVAYAPADAGYRDAVAERTGLVNIFDQEGKQKTNANSKTPGWKYPNEQDFTTWRAGDIVTLDAGKDRYFGYKSPKGYTTSDNSGVTHNGVITGFTETGRPIITHGGASGKNKGKQYSEVLGDDNRVRNLGHGRYAVKSVWRPKEVDDSGKVSSIENVIDTREERAGRKQATTSNSSFYLKPTEEEKLQQEFPVGYEFSGASNRLNTKNKLVNLFNDEKLNKDLQYKLGITAQELDKLKPVVYGVFGQESNFNDIDSPGASFKELIGNLFGNNSRGGAQIKMSSLTADEKKVLGVKKASDLDKDEVAYKAALLMLNNGRKRMNQEIEQGTHPELADKDEYFRAGYYYNSPARAVQSSEEFTKRKNKKATFSNIKKNELRMDEGSYPYKLMERAKDLGTNIDFDATVELEPVVLRSMVKNNKGTTFVPKQETGGWLNKYK